VTRPLAPLLVRARLAGGIAHAAPWGIALDGLLASEIWHDRKADLRARGQPVPGLADVAIPEDLDLPLARCPGADGSRWHWAATCSFPEGLPVGLPDVRYWTGRLDSRAAEHAAQRLPSRIPERQGRYRARRMPLLVTVTASVTWHAVGDLAAIGDLLTGIRAIGKKRSYGEGHVLSWEVTPAPLTWWAAAHLHPDGTLGRPAPAACLAGRGAVTGGGTGTAGLRPPYMHPARQYLLHLPAWADG
jgi:CRISPR type IV-associated protein Csf3